MGRKTFECIREDSIFFFFGGGGGISSSEEGKDEWR